MIRTQIQLPTPLYRRLKRIAEEREWSLAEVVRRSAEQYVARFPEGAGTRETWTFPTLASAGDFVADPAGVRPEVDAVSRRSGR
jgi:predicted transcriptional regulator